jgi:hypothetical protein
VRSANTRTPSGRGAVGPRRRAAGTLTRAAVRRHAWWVEVGVVLTFYLLYAATRAMAPGTRSEAEANAGHVMALERATGLHPERLLNHAVAPVGWLSTVAGYYYLTLHFVVTVAVLGLVHVRRPHLYAWARTSLGPAPPRCWRSGSCRSHRRGWPKPGSPTWWWSTTSTGPPARNKGTARWRTSTPRCRASTSGGRCGLLWSPLGRVRPRPGVVGPGATPPRRPSWSSPPETTTSSTRWPAQHWCWPRTQGCGGLPPPTRRTTTRKQAAGRPRLA